MTDERALRCEIRLKESRLTLALGAIKLATSYSALRISKYKNSKGPDLSARAPFGSSGS